MAGYVLGEFKWGTGELGTPGGTVQWSFAETPGVFHDFSQPISNPDYQAVVRDAFEAWEQVTSIDFVEVPDSSQVPFRLGWQTLDGPYGTIGIAHFSGSRSYAPLYSISRAEVVFDPDEAWSLKNPASSQTISLYAVAVHEIGHVLGLGHPPEPGTIMYYQYQHNVQDLTAADIAGIQALYGTADTDPAETGGDDLLVSGPEDDILNGGAGVDTVVYSGDQSSYTLTLSPNAITVTDRRAGGDGSDALIDVERLAFNASEFDLRTFAGPAGLSQEAFESIIELYIAYFNRAPDAVGLNFWGTAFATGTSLEEMAALFVDQGETRATYPAGTANDAFAQSVYENVLGRAPDSAGLDFWVEQLDFDFVSRDQFILQVLRGAKSDLKPELGQAFVDQQLTDQAYLSGKTAIGAYFAVHKGMSNRDNAYAAMMLFDGTQSSIDTVIAAIDSYYAAALDATAGEFLMPVVGVLEDPFTVS